MDTKIKTWLLDIQIVARELPRLQAQVKALSPDT